MSIKIASVLVFCLLCCPKPSLIGQTVAKSPWTLPQGLSVKDDGLHTYRFTVEYSTANSRGEVIRRQRLSGEYTRGFGGGEVSWKNVTESDADGPNASFSPPQKREFMEGFRYREDSPAAMTPGFFKSFPATAFYERNLIWDTGMLESFGQNFFEHLKLNEPYTPIANENVPLPDLGSFHNNHVQLEWVGRSERNGQECALILYRAFFNGVDLATGGMTMKGRSDYWGEIWVSLTTKQIEYATLYENVMGEMKLPNSETINPINVFRTGIFEPINSKQSSDK